MAYATANSRGEQLHELRDRVRTSDMNSDDVFQQVFCDCQKFLELSDQAAADLLMVTRPTVNRWARGKNLPHRALRQHLRNWMDEQLTKRIKAVEYARGGGAPSYHGRVAARAV